MLISDWSSDVCSSDLLSTAESVVSSAGGGSRKSGHKPQAWVGAPLSARSLLSWTGATDPERGASVSGRERPVSREEDDAVALVRVYCGLANRKSVGEGRSVSVRLVPGGRGSIK